MANTLNSVVITRVRNGESTPYRPQLPELSEMGPSITELVEKCWQEAPESRPTFDEILPLIRKEAGNE